VGEGVGSGATDAGVVAAPGDDVEAADDGVAVGLAGALPVTGGGVALATGAPFDASAAGAAGASTTCSVTR
jgi:hypothetical protein